MLSFFPRGVLDEILNLIESVSEEFPFYSNIIRLQSERNGGEKLGGGSVSQHSRTPFIYINIIIYLTQFFKMSLALG